MLEQLSIWDVLNDKKSEIELLDDLDILHKIEQETDLYFKNKKEWECGITDYWTNYSKTRLSIHFSKNKFDDHKIICIEADRTMGGCGIPCDTLQEAIKTILMFKEWAKEQNEIFNTRM